MNKQVGLGLILLIVLCSFQAYAAAPTDSAGVLDGLLKSIRTETAEWFSTLGDIATRVLIILSVISWTWAAGQLILKGAELQAFIVELVRLIMVTGFFLALIINAKDWVSVLFSGFAYAAQSASAPLSSIDLLSPTAIIVNGFNVGAEMVEKSGAVTVVPMAILAGVIVVIYALIGAFVFITLCEAYIVTAAGILLLGFGGSVWTADYAKRYLIYCMSVGIKLYMVFIVLGLGNSVINEWVNDVPKDSLSAVLPILGVSIFYLLMLKMLPDLVQSLINGASISSYSPGTIGQSASSSVRSATARTTGAVASAVRAASAVRSGVSLARSQRASGDSSSSTVAQAAKNLGGALLNNITSDYRTSLGKANANMKDTQASYQGMNAVKTSEPNKQEAEALKGSFGASPKYHSPINKG